MTGDNPDVGGRAMNGEWYAAECGECNQRTRDETKIGKTHDSVFCDSGTFVEFEGFEA